MLSREHVIKAHHVYTDIWKIPCFQENVVNKVRRMRRNFVMTEAVSVFEYFLVA